MPIRIENRHSSAGVIYNCQGVMTINDFLEAGNGFLAFPEEIKKWRYCIIDLTSVESMNIGFEDVRSVVLQNRRIAACAPPGVLISVVSPNDLGYGLSRMWEFLVEETGWETKTFRSRTEADQWIQERAKTKFGLNLTNLTSALDGT